MSDPEQRIERVARAMWEAREDAEIAESPAPNRCPFEADDVGIWAMARAADAISFAAGQDNAIINLATALQKWCPEAIDVIRAKAKSDDDALNDFLAVLAAH